MEFRAYKFLLWTMFIAVWVTLVSTKSPILGLQSYPQTPSPIILMLDLTVFLITLLALLMWHWWLKNQLDQNDGEIPCPGLPGFLGIDLVDGQNPIISRSSKDSISKMLPPRFIKCSGCGMSIPWGQNRCPGCGAAN